MTLEPDPYKVLQVDPSAEPEVIEAAYRALSRKWRPKIYASPEAAERIRQVDVAYDILRKASESNKVGGLAPAGTDLASGESEPPPTPTREPARIMRVFVASPEDVRNERELLENLIRELNAIWISDHRAHIELVKWESLPYTSGVSIDQANERAIDSLTNDDYDLFIGMLWRRFGARAARVGAGTAYECEQAYERFYYNERPAMFFFNDAPIPPELLKAGDLAKVRQFRERLGKPRVSRNLRQFLELLGRYGILRNSARGPADTDDRERPPFFWDFTGPGHLVSLAREQLNSHMGGWTTQGVVGNARRQVAESDQFPGVSGHA